MDKFRHLLLDSNNLAITSLCITLSALFIYSIFKLVRVHFKNYSSGFRISSKVKFSTRKITYVAMMVGVSVATTTVISLTLPITVLPPIRVAFEGVMIKITGMIFGPFVGLTVGIVTELLTLMFVPSYIHVAYLIVAFSFGFWSGMTSYAFKLKKNWLTLVFVTVFLLISAGIMFWLMQGMKEINPETSLFGVKIPADIYPFLFLIMISITLIFIYGIVLVLHIRKRQKWLEVMLPIILLCVISEILVTVLVAAWGDYQMFGLRNSSGSENPFITMVVVRIIQIPIKIFFNTAILTTVYIVLRPLIKVK
ncbi:putative membrane protein [Mycoplasma leachii PG50]|uniref:Putative membrane protein n=1 Tax=Mycoplasma leachii (strain DSM 21131 / NCTC 10133 / N29 / PG50) TaxID=880447 RepID=E4PTC4_MYCLG|nr:ECF transporter S component [Mycoplasma leachii]ADR24513.1 putative membrane protein [Mycoplasma leachii PG50]CBV66859.1 Membrane protein, putative [Mycoplasma leachii 99/014/6]